MEASRIRDSMQELSKENKDMFILGLIFSSRASKEAPVYSIHGKIVCSTTFQFLLDLSEKTLRNLHSHYDNNGITLRVHGNTKRLPVNSCSFECVEGVKNYILNYADKHGEYLPGRIPGFHQQLLSLLPSSESK